MKNTEARAESLKASALNNIKQEDLLHRGFLKPIEIALKTYKTQPQNPNLKPGELPRGLKIVVKQSLTSDKRTFHNLVAIQRNISYEDIKMNNQDNILSLMKKENGGIKLAICICMYSQDKKRLKSTLSGVAKNIANLVAYERMDPDQIGVFVIIDGIEKVDYSVIDYFEELERSNHINLGDNIVPPLTIQEIANKAWNLDQEEIEQMQIKNVNNYLFDIVELQERNNLRFAQVRQDYDEIKQLQSQIKKLKQGRPLFDDLPAKLRPFFFQQAKEERKKDYAMSDQDIKQQQRNQYEKQRFQKRLLQDYALDILKVRPLVMKTLQDGDRFCSNYLSTRQDLAYLTCFRNKIKFNQEQRHSALNNRQNIYQEQQNPMQNNYTYMNLFMCVKYKNSGKLSSHNWFFNGFCQQLRPQFAVLLDVGLKPQDDAILKMYRYLEKNKRTQQQQRQSNGGVGGVCGYMSIKIEKIQTHQEIKDQDVDFLTSIISKFVDIQRTQQVQYHFAHLLDKGFQASFGFIHVLPGAFSAYNMKAIIDYENPGDDQLLKNYFKSIDQKLANRKVVQSEMTKTNVALRTFLPDFINNRCITIDPYSDQAMLYNQNVYLAEDRILCMGIHKKGYDMSYLPDAYAEVDPIKTVHDLLGQRKRWINGSYFAFQKVKQQLKEHENRNGYQILLNLQIIYLSLMNSLSYFAPALFLFTVHIAMQAFRADVLTKVLSGVVNNPDGSQFYNAFVFTMDFIYVMLIMTIIFLSLHLNHKHKRLIPYIYGISTLFGLFMACVFIVLVVDILRGLISQEAFLIQNKALIGTIPGGSTTLSIMRWLLVSSIVIYIVPISIYILLFKNCHILCEIVLGSISFLFYSPTYLNILSVYSLCRIDDISWGTKGIQTVSAANNQVKASWKLIKFVHVIKFVLWNIILGVILLSLGSSYTSRFFVTMIMVILIGVSMGFKVLISCGYMLKYWCKYRTRNENPVFNINSRIADVIRSYQGNIMREVEQNLQGIKREYLRNSGNVGSFIQMKRKGEEVKNAFRKQQVLQKNRSSIQGKFGQSMRKNVIKPLATIIEENNQESLKLKKQQKKNEQQIIEMKFEQKKTEFQQKTLKNDSHTFLNKDQRQSKQLNKSFIENSEQSLIGINPPKIQLKTQQNQSPDKLNQNFTKDQKKIDKNKFKKAK